MNRMTPVQGPRDQRFDDYAALVVTKSRWISELMQVLAIDMPIVPLDCVKSHRKCFE